MTSASSVPYDQAPQTYGGSVGTANPAQIWYWLGVYNSHSHGLQVLGPPPKLTTGVEN